MRRLKALSIMMMPHVVQSNIGHWEWLLKAARSFQQGTSVSARTAFAKCLLSNLRCFFRRLICCDAVYDFKYSRMCCPFSEAHPSCAFKRMAYTRLTVLGPEITGYFGSALAITYLAPSFVETSSAQHPFLLHKKYVLTRFASKHLTESAHQRTLQMAS